MAKIIWTAKALNNLKEIYLYINSYSSLYANKTTKEITTYIKVLEKYPEIGKVFHKGIYTYRRILFKKHIVIYNILNNTIIISAIYHQSKLISEIDFI